MGYTHYWNTQASTEDQLQASVLDCAKIVAASPVPLAAWDGEGGDPECSIGAVVFNGVGPNDDHETFKLSTDRSEYDFCKTANKPYDVVVVACLCALASHAGSGVVSSDGNAGDWSEGRALAELALGRPIANPIGEA